MKINIVTVTSGWILQKISERTANACNNLIDDHTMTVSHSPDLTADANYYADLQNCYHGEKTKCDVAYFTHADLNSPHWLLNLLNSTRSFQNLDGIVSMNKRYTEMLISLGWPREKIETITPGETKDMFPLKKIQLGIVSKGGYPGYGQQFMEAMLRNYDFKNFKLRILGDGWGALAPIAVEKNVDLELITDKDYSVYPKFYQEIDYLLIPGLWTAGPISFQEALSTGTAVISANVGFAGYEFTPDYMFNPNDVMGLSRILDEIKTPLLDRRSQVEHMTWEKYAMDVITFINKVKKT
jgi:glycosyltransferase involved in cell wall biosynthesis